MYRRFYSCKTGYTTFLGKATKQISVRLPQEIYDIIDSYTGRNFSDKLVKYIYDHENDNLG